MQESKALRISAHSSTREGSLWHDKSLWHKSLWEVSLPRVRAWHVTAFVIPVACLSLLTVASAAAFCHIWLILKREPGQDEFWLGSSSVAVEDRMVQISEARTLVSANYIFSQYLRANNLTPQDTFLLIFSQPASPSPLCQVVLCSKCLTSVFLVIPSFMFFHLQWFTSVA